MKKTKFMIGALVLSMGLLGTGYAAWTDTLAVDTTVNTGNLNIKFDKLHRVDQYMNNDIPGVLGSYTTFKSSVGLAAGEDNGDFNNTNDQINIAINKMVPGASTKVTAKMVNDGTVAARLTKITPNLKERMDPELQKALNIEIKVFDRVLLKDYTIYEGTLNELIESGGATTEEQLGDILFVPGTLDKDIDLEINVRIDKDVTNEVQEQATSFAIEFLFEQAFEPGKQN